MSPTCIDMKKHFADRRYKFTLDPAAQYESGGTKDPWYYIIPCKRGEIYPYGGKRLAAMVTAIRIACRIEREHPEWEVIQDATDGRVFAFPVDDIDKIAAYIHPKCRRRVSPEQREQMIKRLKPYYYNSKSTGQGAV